MYHERLLRYVGRFVSTFALYCPVRGARKDRVSRRARQVIQNACSACLNERPERKSGECQWYSRVVRTQRTDYFQNVIGLPETHVVRTGARTDSPEIRTNGQPPVVLEATSECVRHFVERRSSLQRMRVRDNGYSAWRRRC